ncbi:MAG: M48 family metallopeptidase [Alphaproteobacteria bacterium]|nr:M48 family metallopeptidase [Alphaproteobacteria bacterium]
MSVPVTAYDHIYKNNAKTALLVALFPIALSALFVGLAFVFFLFSAPETTPAGTLLSSAWQSSLTALRMVAPGLAVAALIWMLAALFFGDKIMLSLAHAAPLTPETPAHRQIIRAVENVALAAGLPTPKIYLIDDESLNAFAAGYAPKTSSVTLTTGLVKKLTPLELEGVIAHEIAHIGNRDVRLNMVVLVGLSICGMLADMLGRSFFYGAHRSRGGDKDKGGAQAILLIAWLTLIVFNVIIAPLIFFAISRTREYAADATGALITRNPKALASALQKISGDARVEVLDETPHMAAACIYTPRAEARPFLGIGDTHPPVSERIRRLKAM